MSKGFFVAVILSVVVLIGGAFMWKSHKQSETFEKARTDAVDRFKYHRDLETEYITGLVREFHADAFEDSYAFGSLVSGASFEEEEYFRRLIDMMVQRCAADGKSEQIGPLTTIGGAYGYTGPETPLVTPPAADPEPAGSDATEEPAAG